MTVSLAHPNSLQRSKFKSKVKDWVKLFLAQQEVKSISPNSKSPGFVTFFEQAPDVVMA